MRDFNIIFCGYRSWAFEVIQEVLSEFGETISFTICVDPNALKKAVENKNQKIDLIFFIGWSWIVSDYIVDNYTCICAHPSSLPEYRGGSPIQHQIINGEENSEVTFFIMNKEIDCGPIICSIFYSLLGSLEEVIGDIICAAEEGVVYIINEFIKVGKVHSVIQKEIKPIYKRRTPNMSEIEVSDFKKYFAKDLYNKIRALQDPYPNAFVTCKDGTRLFIIDTYVKEEEENVYENANYSSAY